jgi:hypothetical protein
MMSKPAALSRRARRRWRRRHLGSIGLDLVPTRLKPLKVALRQLSIYLRILRSTFALSCSISVAVFVMALPHMEAEVRHHVI